MNRFHLKNISYRGVGLALLVIGLIGIVGSGCQSSTAAYDNQNTPSPMAKEVVSFDRTPTVQASPAITVANTSVDNTITLTFWTVESFSPKAEGEAGDFINKSLRAFEQANPNIKVDLLLKKPTGKGGMLDFLRTARDVAPSVLPDVAVLNATDLNQAYADGLLQSLDGRLSRPIVQDLLPAARRMGTVGDKLIGVPLALEMEHNVYSTQVFTTTPLLWTDVLSSHTVYLFPAKGINGLVNDVSLSQYFSAGGKFLDEQGKPTIDDRVLRNVLDFYQQALESGVINSEVLETGTTEELWPIYLAGDAGMAQISVHQYLLSRDSLDSTAFAPIPVSKEKDIPVAITHGWALVLITNDANRQSAALSLIEWFLSTSNNATWNSINKSIPTRDTAYQQLAGDDPYWVFLTEQLNAAQPQPAFNGYDRLGRIIQQAIEQVISGEATPEEATATAMDALGQ